MPGHTAGHIAYVGDVDGRAVAVLRRHAVRRRLRPAVRGHAGADVDVAVEARRARRRDARLLRRTSTRWRTCASRAAVEPGNAASRARDAREQAQARARPADAAVDDRRRARDQSVPARGDARGARGRGGACGPRARRRRRRRSPTLRAVEERLPVTRVAALGLTVARERAPTIARALVAAPPRIRIAPESHFAAPAARRSRSPRARRPHRRRRAAPPTPVIDAVAARADCPTLPPKIALAPTAVRGGGHAPSSSRCRRRPATCGTASSRGYAMPDLEGPLVEKWEQWYADAARLRGAHGRAQPALPLSHRRRGRGARHAARDRAAADGRERVQPERDVDAAARRASGSSCRRPASTTA